MNDLISYLVRHLLEEIPYIIANIGGIVAACILWRRAPKASLCLILVCAYKLTNLVLYPVSWWCVLKFGGQNGDSFLRSVFSFFWYIPDTAFLVLTFVAVYIGRGQPNTALEPTPTAP